jgi:hypothetical protein
MVGCATYQAYSGPRRSTNEVAVFIANDFVQQLSEPDTTVYLRKVNGFAVAKDRVAVLPGPCEVELSLRIDDYGSKGNSITSNGNLTVAFEAVANAEYFFRGYLSGDSWQAQVYRGGVGKVAESLPGKVHSHGVLPSK